MDVSRGSARVLITPNTSDSEMVALTDGNTDSNLKKKHAQTHNPPPPHSHPCTSHTGVYVHGSAAGLAASIMDKQQ